MNHIGTQVIETDRLILRPFTLEDAEAAFRNWQSDPEVTKYLTWRAKKDVSESEDIIKEWIENYKDPSFYNWAIVLKDIDEPIGSIGVVNINTDISAVEIGYSIGNKWWNKGITSEALSALLSFFFNEVSLNRIVARHDTENINSGKVMKKCGLKYEGTLKEASKNNRGLIDTSIYGLVKKDFEDFRDNFQ